MNLAQVLKIKLARRLRKKGDLKHQLLKSGKTRWLDIGGSKPESGFKCLDITNPNDVAPEDRENFYSASILRLAPDDYANLGKFDLVRMQHVFEHFSPEHGSQVLLTVSRLLSPGGYLLMTVPDLRLHVKAYLSNYHWGGNFVEFARAKRIPHDAPASFVFSTHVHQAGYSPNETPGQAHKWCYDYEGLEYQVRKSGQFQNIRRLDILDPLASKRFTHNRWEEDVCLLAEKL